MQNYEQTERKANILAFPRCSRNCRESEDTYNLALHCSQPVKSEVRPFCWTDLTIRYMVMSSVLHRTHSVQFFLDSNFVVITQIFIKFFQKVLDRVELLQI